MVRFRKSILEQIGEITKKYANLPDSYIKRASEYVEYKTPKLRQYLPKEISRFKYKFDVHRPWTQEFKDENKTLTHKGEIFPIVEPVKDWSYFKGDRVKILVGLDKGKMGIISHVYQERNWVIVQGLNWDYKKIGEMGDYPGMYVKWEKPLLINREVVLIDPSDDKPTKIEWRYTEEGEKVRVSLRSGRIIPTPAQALETYDYKTKGTYVENEKKDTKSKDVEEVTFHPTLQTFEMDIMEAMDIKEDRKPKKTFWY